MLTLGIDRKLGGRGGLWHQGQMGIFLYEMQQSKRLPLLAVAWEIWMLALSLQASIRVKGRKRRRKGFMFSKV